MSTTTKPAPHIRSWRSLVLLCIPFILEGCIAIPVPQRMGGGSVRLLERKVVADLREPSILIAADRTACQVSRDRFERTRRGDRVMCAWRRHD